MTATTNRALGWTGTFLIGLLGTAGCDRNDLGGSYSLGGGSAPVVECPPKRTPNELRGKIYINEIMLENETTLEDENGFYPAWIELYNNTDEEFDFGDVTLSNDFLGDPSKWRFPCVRKAKVPPRGYLIVYLDGDEESELDFHANFTIGPGTSFQLILGGGADLLSFDGSKIGPDQSAGRFPDGGKDFDVMDAPSPLAENTGFGGGASEPEGVFLRGDANGDARVNVTDMTFVLKVLFGQEGTPACEDQLDSDDSGDVNVTDAVYIGNALFGRGQGFPPPFPSAGTDPTADDLPCPLE